jgi:hypothetical protein
MYVEQVILSPIKDDLKIEHVEKNYLELYLTKTSFCCIPKFLSKGN